MEDKEEENFEEEPFEGLPSIDDFIINHNIEYPVDLSGLEHIIELVSSKMNFSKHKTSMICVLFLNEVRNALYQNKKVIFIHFGMLVPFGKSSIALVKKRGSQNFPNHRKKMRELKKLEKINGKNGTIG